MLVNCCSGSPVDPSLLVGFTVWFMIFSFSNWTFLQKKFSFQKQIFFYKFLRCVFGYYFEILWLNTMLIKIAIKVHTLMSRPAILPCFYFFCRCRQTANLLEKHWRPLKRVRTLFVRWHVTALSCSQIMSFIPIVHNEE